MKILEYQYLLIASCILSCFIIKNKLSLFIFFTSIVILELVATNHSIIGSSDYIIYYLFISGISNIFYYYIFSNKFNLSYVLILLFWLIIWIFSFYLKIVHDKASFTFYILGLIIAFYFIIHRFYYNIVTSDYLNIWKEYETYLGLGVIIFITCSFPILVFTKYFITSNLHNKAFSDLLRIGNIFLHLGYLLAVLCLIRNSYIKSS